MNSRRVLICGLNWIGDNVMAMPAVQAYRRAHPDDPLTVLVKQGLGALWKMNDAPSNIIEYDDTNAGTFRAGFALKRERFDLCYVLPHSFRSAWIPFLARIPERVGLPGGIRDNLLTRVASHRTDTHQQYEYMDLLVPDSAPPEAPRLAAPPESVARALDILHPLPSPLVGLIPGAARGPSKRWPAVHFVTIGRRLAGARKCGIVTFGAPSEKDLCQSIASGIGDPALNLAGTTTLPEWAALLQACDVVICNDSGGMHLAAAVGTPVVAVYGMTDPSKTGPLGPRARVIHDGGARGRDIAPISDEAEKRLAAIPPDAVYEAAAEFLKAHR